MRRRLSIAAVAAWLLVLGAVAVWSGALWIDRYSDDVTTSWDKIWGTSHLAFPRDRVDPAAVVAGWLGVVSKTMHPSLAAVWVRERP